MKTLLVCKSIHHGNTQKVAERMSDEINAILITPDLYKESDINNYDLIGFGSGIYSDTFHPSIIKLIESLPSLKGKKVFLFSTAGVIYDKSQRQMRKILLSKEAEIVGEFCCKGFNTNLFLKFFGGMNKNRPNEEDYNNARLFAKDMLSKA